MEHCNARTKAASANGAPPADPGPWTGAGYCKRPAGWGVPETTSGRCKNHGGASLKGAGHPRVTDLRSSRYVPKWLADDYEASLRRTDQLALDEQFATVDARIAEVFRGMPEGAGSALWLRVRAGAGTRPGANRRPRRGRLMTEPIKEWLKQLLSEAQDWQAGAAPEEPPLLLHTQVALAVFYGSDSAMSTVCLTGPAWPEYRTPKWSSRPGSAPD
jgi:hypothetical protein